MSVELDGEKREGVVLGIGWVMVEKKKEEGKVVGEVMGKRREGEWRLVEGEMVMEEEGIEEGEEILKEVVMEEE